MTTRTGTVVSLRPLALVVLVVVGLTLSGCESDSPSYATVRAEANDALETIRLLIPGETAVHALPEERPSGCRDPLAGMGRDGAFATTHWDVDVSPGTDVARLIDQLPEMLGEGWHVERISGQAPYPQVHLVRDEPNVRVTVGQSHRDGALGVDLVAVSRCGILAGESGRRAVLPHTDAPHDAP